MEEYIGLWWHRGVSAWTKPGFDGASCTLEPQRKYLSLIYRFLGGAAGVSLETAAQHRHAGYRSWLQRLSGQHQKLALAWSTEEVWCLPEQLNCYPTRALNDTLYLWLTAMASIYPCTQGHWMERNQQATCYLLKQYPGLNETYPSLVQAELQQRQPTNIPAERVIIDLLHHPFSAIPCGLEQNPAQQFSPVWLWLNQFQGSDHRIKPSFSSKSDQSAKPTQQRKRTVQRDDKRRQAETVDNPERQDGLLIFRPESIFSWSEFTQVNHEQQDNDEDDLGRAADDLDQITLSSTDNTSTRVLSMNLEKRSPVPTPHSAHTSASVDEWDYQRQSLRHAQCSIRLQLPPALDPNNTTAPIHFRQSRQLQQMLAHIQPERRRIPHQAHGDLDVQRYLERLGQDRDELDCFTQLRARQRDLSCIILADISLSTESSISGDARIIDVIGESLVLFAEALHTLGDRWALYTFNSIRHDIHITPLKAFATPPDFAFNHKVLHLQPQGYTRMGPAIRYMMKPLNLEKSRERMLLLLSDGKPNDADYYEGRYGLEDTRHAVQEARKAGIKVFCITIDQDAPHYLPHIFGPHGFTVIRKIQDLPKQLPLLYAQLTRH